jgi:pyruvate/2-oxoglutarate dehydrogenase complex dihydrolipoamide dehydrogenase (E3) component
VIATGSSPAIPPIPGLEDTPYLTNETVFDLTVCPARLGVIGAGPIGLELAQAFRRLGADVTVLEAAVPLADDDPECARVVLDALAREGIRIRSGVAITSIRGDDGKVAITIGKDASAEVIEASHLLLATGRRPNIDELGLEVAGIAYDHRGITVDRGLRTTNRRVYAIGDVAGGMQFTHVASHHAGLVIRNALFRLPVKTTEDLWPRVTFTDPELAQVGLTEAAARARGRRFKVLRWAYHDNDRAQAERRPRGHIKVITTPRGRILGATIVGAQAGELIATWTLALSRRMNVRHLAGTVFPYPTLSEIGTRAAISFFTPGLTNPMVRRIIGWLRRLG